MSKKIIGIIAAIAVVVIIMLVVLNKAEVPAQEETAEVPAEVTESVAIEADSIEADSLEIFGTDSIEVLE